MKTDFTLEFENLDWENVVPSPDFNLTNVRVWAKHATGFVLLTMDEANVPAYSMLNVSQENIVEMLMLLLEGKPYVRSALFGQLARRLMIILEGLVEERE